MISHWKQEPLAGPSTHKSVIHTRTSTSGSVPTLPTVPSRRRLVRSATSSMEKVMDKEKGKAVQVEVWELPDDTDEEVGNEDDDDRSSFPSLGDLFRSHIDAKSPKRSGLPLKKAAGSSGSQVERSLGPTHDRRPSSKPREPSLRNQKSYPPQSTRPPTHSLPVSSVMRAPALAAAKSPSLSRNSLGNQSISSSSQQIFPLGSCQPSERRPTSRYNEPIDLCSVSGSSTRSDVILLPAKSLPRNGGFGSHRRPAQSTTVPKGRMMTKTPSRENITVVAGPPQTDTPLELKPGVVKPSVIKSSVVKALLTGHSPIPTLSISADRKPAPTSTPQLKEKDKPPSSHTPLSKKLKRYQDYAVDPAYRPKSSTSQRTGSASSASATRPVRARPDPGKYVIPTMETPIHDWPTTQGTQGPPMKRMKRHGSVWVGKAEEAAARVQNPLTPKGDVTAKMERIDTTLPDVSATKMSRDSSTSTLTVLSETLSPPVVPSTEGKDRISINKEEAQEEIEDPPVEPEAEPEIDILAQYADFEFTVATPDSSPAELPQEDPHIHRSPMKQASITLPVDPSQEIKLSITLTPSKASTTTPHTTYPHILQRPSLPPSKRLRSHSPSLLLTPSKLKIIATVSPTKPSNRLVSSILAEHEASRAAELAKEREAAEARRQRIDAILKGDGEQSDEEMEPFEHVFDVPKSPSPQESAPTRTSNRVRTASNPNAPNSASPLQKPVEMAKLKPHSSGIEELLRQREREARKGMTAELINAAHAAGRRKSDGRNKGDRTRRSGVPYPTPISHGGSANGSGEEWEVGEDEEEEESVEVDEGRVDAKQVAQLKREGLDLDEEVIRDAKRAKFDSGILIWEGFWEDIKPAAHMKVEQPVVDLVGQNPMTATLQRALSEKDLPTISAMITSGVCNGDLREGANTAAVCSALLFLTLNPTIPDQGSLATEILLFIITTAPSHPFTSSADTLAVLIQIWRQLGARQGTTQMAPPLPRNMAVFVSREAASDLICAIAGVTARYGWLLASDARKIIPVLLLLAIDSQTSSGLRRSIDDCLFDLLPVAISDSTAAVVAQDVLQLLRPYSLNVRVQALLVIGQGSDAGRGIGRWIAMDLLVPGSSNSLSKRIVPTLDVLVTGAETIYKIVTCSDPDHEQISNLLICLSEAMSDFDALIASSTRAKDEVEELREVLLLIHRKIPNRLSGSADSKNKARASQLHMMLGQQIPVAFKRAQNRRVDGMQGLKFGERGQARLSFGPKPMAVEIECVEV